MSGTALIEIEALTPAKVFAPGGVEPILQDLERRVRGQKTQVVTSSGRDAVRSLAYKVARSKTALDDMGKALTEEWRRATQRVNADRAIIRDRLDALQAEVRAPLTAWENAEKARVDGHNAALAEITEEVGPAAADIAWRLNHLRHYPARDWEEFAEQARVAIEREIARLEALHADAVRREAEAAELAALRAEKARRDAEQAERERAAREQREAQERAEREAQIAAEAAARATREAEAQLERERAARAAAEQRAAADAAAAVEAERRRVAAEQAAADAEARRRAADRQHRAAINNEVAKALAACGLDTDAAKAVVAAIARGAVPHVSITY